MLDVEVGVRPLLVRQHDVEADRLAAALLAAAVRAFHDAVLELGSVPLPVVQSRIDRFIAAGGQGPYPDVE